MNIVILAAGKGTRMCSHFPKVLHCVGGKPLLQHVVEAALGLAPAENIYVVYGYQGDLLKAQFGQKWPINWVLQSEQRGTGDAVACAVQAMPCASEPTLVLYGDVPLVSPETLAQLVSAYSESPGCALLTTIHEDPSGYGRILRDQNQHIVGIVEEKEATQSQKKISEVNTGILLANTAHLKHWLKQLQQAVQSQREVYLTDVVSLAHHQGIKVCSCQPVCHWEVWGANDPCQLERLERVYQQKLAEILLKQGVKIADASRIDIRGMLSCGRDVFIDVGCIFEGEVHLGDGVRIGPYVTVRDSSIDSCASIEAFSCIVGACVGAKARLGPYARIREGTHLAENVRIGNFVEVKQANIAQGAKLNHLSYVGDADIGAEVNVGAGSVTCNYDGLAKHRTIVGAGTFIGSGSLMVAPIEIGANSTLGAGTVVTKNVPEKTLALSRVVQKHIHPWKPKSKS